MDYYYGPLGLGFGKDINSNRTNLVDELVNQGLTHSKALGLALGILSRTHSGSLVLGGVDTKKFSGALQHITIFNARADPLNKNYSEYRYWICIDRQTLRGVQGNRTTYAGFNTIFRSTGNLGILPLGMVSTIAVALGIYNISAEN